MYKRIIGVLMAVALLLTIIGAALYTQSPAGEEPFPRVIAMVPDWSGFVDYADKWNFGGVLVTTSTEAMEGRFVGAQMGDQSVTSLGKDEWTEIIPVGMQVEGRLDEYEELHRLVVGQHARRGWVSPSIAARYGRIRWDLQTIIAQETQERGVGTMGISMFMPPMQITPGETEIVELIFEVRKKDEPNERQQMTALTSVSNLALPPEGIPEPGGIPEE